MVWVSSDDAMAVWCPENGEGKRLGVVVLFGTAWMAVKGHVSMHFCVDEQ